MPIAGSCFLSRPCPAMIGHAGRGQIPAGRPEELHRFTALLLAEVKSQALLIEKLRHQLAGHRNSRFGTSSETIEQLQLALETSEIAIARMTAKLGLPEEEPKDEPRRRPIPDHIPRQEMELTTGGNDCAHCGGLLRRLGEDVTEELEYVPGKFIVNRIVRPRMACSGLSLYPNPPAIPSDRARPSRTRPAGACPRLNTAITCRSTGRARSSTARDPTSTDRRRPTGSESRRRCWNR